MVFSSISVTTKTIKSATDFACNGGMGHPLTCGSRGMSHVNHYPKLFLQGNVWCEARRWKAPNDLPKRRAVASRLIETATAFLSWIKTPPPLFYRFHAPSPSRFIYVTWSALWIHRHRIGNRRSYYPHRSSHNEAYVNEGDIPILLPSSHPPFIWRMSGWR